jgi:hypothetical protein
MRFERGGVRLAGLDFGGEGPAALLLHGLAGYAGEWAEAARWLTGRCRVLALDARGHGGSERSPADVSRAAHVADAGPGGFDDADAVEANVEELLRALRRWPVPFASRGTSNVGPTTSGRGRTDVRPPKRAAGVAASHRGKGARGRAGGRGAGRCPALRSQDDP